ncbi:Uma2 family endonuclease [Nakamurella sp. UYEF19]|uniref:Uma2 family endonuclease n=1 Tax=Nakamurella sp. UYEF19 TaxID=1756392 RepID=UPI0033990A76
MTMMNLPDHLLTLAEGDELPEEGYRWAELVEGVLQVSPSPAFGHQLALSRLVITLGPVVQDAGSVAITVMDVLIDRTFPATVRQPDLSIIDLAVIGADPKRLHASDVKLAVEIVSPGSGRRDRGTKLSEYAEAGIMSYWILDIAGPAAVLDVYELDGTSYRLVRHAEGGTVDVERPFAVTLDLDALQA